nr:uncharacterized protein LOC103347245 isoform X11 [Oryctolagus cuniculus]
MEIQWVVLWPHSIPYESLGLLGSFTQSLVDHHHTLLHNSGLFSGHTASLMRALGSWARSLSLWWTIITPSCTTVVVLWPQSIPYESLGLLGSFTQSLVDHHHTLLHNSGLSSGHTASLMRALGSWARSLSPWWTIITPSCTTVGCPLAAEHPYESLGLLGSFTQSLVDRHHHHTLLHNGGCPLAAEHPL